MLLWLKRAFKTNPKTRSAAEIRPLNWLNEYLDIADPDWTRKRDVLLAWARCRAERESFQELIREMGWKSATTYRLRDEAAAQIASRINATIVGLHGHAG
ncbi:hypothetical protein MKK67_07090 [Methylobacterium sp. J-072]|uniref:hypothetical protein n=1 Tax=Methylobacterium sp. J-072 TaxID=2836651 RepID=UPI001FB922BE|nr:hypothetical protein [Methylobacterium sp. J-072]MCJ2092259.1 hypothetical protein [Methylobacterium sp. J-072]